MSEVFSALAEVGIADYKKTHEVDMNSENYDLPTIYDEGENMCVWVGSQGYLMKGVNREKLIKQYHQAWKRVRLNFGPLIADGETLEFTPSEQVSLQQKIVLDWLCDYNKNNRRFRFLFWSMSDSKVLWAVLRAAEARCGNKSEKSIALAAHTLKMSITRFKNWKEQDERRANLW